MKKEEQQELARKIANAEKILQSNSSTKEERNKAYRIIDELCSKKISISDMESIDIMVQDFLK